MTTVKSNADEKPAKSNLSSSSSSSSSDSDGSDSSSDSDSSSAASAPKPKPQQNDKPQFSVMSSDTAGLRMKIAIPRNQITNAALANIKASNIVNNKKSDNGGDKKRSHAPNDSNNSNKSKTTNSGGQNNNKKSKITHKHSRKSDSSSGSSCCSSECSDSDSDSSASEHNKKDAKGKTKFVKRKKANRGGSTSSGGGTESTDSDSSDEHIQEFNPDDLDEILPKDFNESVSNNNAGTSKPSSTSTPAKNIVENSEMHDGASSSDMELPALVNAAIQRVESCSDAESSRTTPATSHYTSNLLREFVVKTQMLGSGVASSSIQNPAAASSTASVPNKDLKTEVDIKTIKTESPVPTNNSNSINGILAKAESNEQNPPLARKRGRPAKATSATVNKSSVAPTSESPDSGILSTHSPTCSPKTDSKKANQKKIDNVKGNSSSSTSNNRISKYTLASIERNTYATERVLYPPRGKKKGPGRPPKEKAPSKEDQLDPVWKKIDISKKFSEPNLSGYKSDGGHSICCSKRLAAQSGYVSDYASASCGKSKMSGYKTDHSTKSRKSGYKSDFSMRGAKSCGYRSDCSVRHRKQVRKKRRKKLVQSNNNNLNNKNYNNQHQKSSTSVSELDILQLAGLTLGNTSEESSQDSLPVSNATPTTSLNKTNNSASASLTPSSRSTSLMPVNNFNGIFSSFNKLSNKYTFSSSNINSKNSFATFLRNNRSKDNGKVVKKLPLSRANVIKNNEELNKKFQKSTFNLSSGISTTSRDMLSNLCERVSKRLSETDSPFPKSSPAKSVCSKRTRRKSMHLDKLETLSTASKSNFLEKIKDQSKMNSIRSRRMSTMSRCSSRSAGSRHHFKKRKRRRLQSRSNSISAKNADSKMGAEIEKLSDSFTNLCKINVEKAGNEAKNKESTASSSIINAAKVVAKRSQKKRKASEHVESPSTSATTGMKRRNKKSAPTQSPDEHKLPLKKRHYLLTPGEKNNDSGAEKEEVVNPCATKNTSTVKDSAKAITPKKRHLLKSPEPILADEIIQIKSSDSPLTISSDVPEQTATGAGKRNDAVARKKNRLEGIMLKLQPTPTGTAILADNNLLAASNKASQPDRPSVIQPTTRQAPPPGIFEPSIDLELQIPTSTLQIPSLITKVEMLDSPRLKETIENLEQEDNRRQGEKVVEKLLAKTGAHLLFKKKRTRKINRTGFPSVKKKKKKPIEKEADVDLKPQIVLDPVVMGIGQLTKHVPSPAEKTATTVKVAVVAAKVLVTAQQNCDRVPKEGETTDRFIERNSKPRLSVVSLERLQGKVPLIEPEKVISPVAAKKNEEQSNNERKSLRGRPRNDQESNKRERDSSQEAKITKKSKKEAPKIIKKDIEKIKARERDLSSDNEPLISLVKLSERTTAKNNKNKENKTTPQPVENKKIKAILDENSSPKSRRTRSTSNVEKEPEIILKTAVIKLQSCLIEPSPTSSVENVTHLKRGRSKSVYKPQEEIIPKKTEDKKKEEKKEETKRVEVKKDETKKVETKKMEAKKIETKKEETKKIDVKKVETKKDEVKKDEAKKAEVKKIEVKKIDIKKVEAKKDEPKKVEAKKIEVKKDETKKIEAKKDEVKKIDVKKVEPKKIEAKKDEANKIDLKKVEVKKNEVKQVETKKDEVKKVEAKKEEVKKVEPKKVEAKKIEAKKDETKKAKKESKIVIEEISREVFEKKKETITELKNIPSPIFNDDLEHDPLPIKDLDQVKSDSRETPSPLLDVKAKKYQRKKYLAAGLFSDHYKEDNKNSSKGKIAENLLPPPLYCEKFLRRAKRDFQLPYDLWIANENGKLPGRDAVPSWNYRKIRANVYYDVKANPSSDHQQCSCKPESGCPDDCLNRLVYTECDTDTCPCGDKCLNTKIQRHEYHPGLEKFMTVDKGFGVRSKETVKKGHFITEYLGEVVTDKEFKERMRSLYLNDTHHYCLNLDNGLVIDGHRMGNDGRFVNHSCQPNCEMQKWSVNGLFRMALFALRDIKPYEELTYDYNFSLFNPAEGQPCKCGSTQCRGVIGGKYQRIKPIQNEKTTEQCQGGSPTEKAAQNTRRKRQAKKNQPISQIKYTPTIPVFHPPTIKEKKIIMEHHCFLIRNLNKIKKLNKKLLPEQTVAPPTSASPAPTLTPKPSLSAQICAVRAPRSIRTRGLAQVEHDPEMEKVARVASVLRQICHEISNRKDKDGHAMITKLQLPSKKKCPLYYERIPIPIDLQQIASNVEKGNYKQPKAFEDDILVMFSNAIKYYGINSPEGVASEDLKSLYHHLKAKSIDKLETIVGTDTEILKGFVPKTEPADNGKPEAVEDIIRCMCGLYKDEGLMIQCSKCLVWQHIECTQADADVENYMCERCEPRDIDYEIPLKEYTEEGYQYFLSLMRGDLQIRQTDTVYVLRDIPMSPDPKKPDAPVKKHTYETIGKVDYSECDIFRIESLWKNNDGKRFAYGHHYLRPHETFHEPTRKFYPNEVVRVPLYEVVPIELIIDRCWVLDPTTFCKGRPADSSEPHVYICELRVDKSARLFSKIPKHQYPVCTKGYAFHKFEQKLKIYKTFAPHDLGELAPATAPKETYKKKGSKKDDALSKDISTPVVPTVSRKASPIIQLIPPPTKTIQEKRTRVEDVLSRLMVKLNTQPNALPAVNISYLLTGRGARLRRTQNSTPVPV